jgi:phage-related protein
MRIRDTRGQRIKDTRGEYLRDTRVSLSSLAIEEKNKLATDSVFLVALKITIPGEAEPIRVVRNNEDLTWQAETWTAFPFELDEIGDEAKGEVPQVIIRVANVSRVMETYLQAYDLYCKNSGWSPIEVSIYVVNTAQVAADPDSAPEVEHIFELKQPKTDSRWATFVLGASNPFNNRFPRNRIRKNQCQFRPLGGTRCAYPGEESECNRTLSRCRDLDNSERFGGFPGVGHGGVIVIR